MARRLGGTGSGPPIPNRVPIGVRVRGAPGNAIGFLAIGPVITGGVTTGGVITTGPGIGRAIIGGGMTGGAGIGAGRTGAAGAGGAGAGRCRSCCCGIPAKADGDIHKWFLAANGSGCAVKFSSVAFVVLPAPLTKTIRVLRSDGEVSAAPDDANAVRAIPALGVIAADEFPAAIAPGAAETAAPRFPSARMLTEVCAGAGVACDELF
ncbi:MAG TPA: hypothetical protein VGR72_07565 [Candidatus Acidoferrales bacterium]|nr:hypothetical protein [Candidatus Acidoferrales bacterium]